MGRTLSVKAPDGASTATYAYAGNKTTVTDPAGKWKAFTTDALGNLVQVEEPGGLLTNYTYNMVNALIRVEMPRGGYTQVRTFNYDPTTLRLTSTVFPENGTTQYFYNADGTLYYKLDAKGQRVEFAYDSYKRVTSVKHGTTVVRTFTYDTAVDGSYQQNLAGRLSSVSFHPRFETTATYQYSYTAAGLPAKKRLLYPWVGLDTDQVNQYDNGGAVYQQDGHRFGVDASGRPVRMYDAVSGADVVNNVQYGYAGQLLQMTVNPGHPGSAVTETRQYNARLQMTRQTATNPWTATALIDMEYRFSATQNNGRIKQSKDWVTGEEVSYSYDSLNRLIAAATTGPEWGYNYGYDGWGNYLSKTLTKGTGTSLSIIVDSATNRIQAPGVGYDANGNMASLNSSTPVHYDFENRVTGYSNVTRHGYDHENRRVYNLTNQVSMPGGYQVFDIVFYGISGQKLRTYKHKIVSEESRPLDATEHHVWFGSKLIISNGKTMVTDRLGSVRSAFTSSVSIERFQYEPYGEERPGATANDKDKFATYYRDGVTGLDYAHNRYYASQWGRFTSPDPYLASGGAREPLSWNRFTYVHSDPVNAYDPYGLFIMVPQSPPPAAPSNPTPPPAGGGGGGGQAVGSNDAKDAPEKGDGERAAPLVSVGTLPSIDEARKRMIDRIDDDCAEALGFKNSDDALTRLSKATIKYDDLGLPTWKDGKMISGEYGKTNPLTDTITINSRISWNSPQNQTVVMNGIADVRDLLFNEARRMGAQSMTATQFLDLTILHELAHTKVFGGKNPDDIGIEQAIWTECIRW